MLFSRYARRTSVRSMKVTGSIMRVIRIRFVAIIGTVFLIVLCLHIWMYSWNVSPTIEEIQKTDEAVELACPHPDLDYKNPLIMKHVKDLGELECRREMDWVEVHRGTILINQDVVKRHGRIKCVVTFFVRQDEFNNRKDKVVEFTSDEGSIRLDQDFFHVKCVSKDKLTWKNMMAGVARNETAVERLKQRRLPDDALKLNVLMFGLDSMSRLHYLRKLPRTCRYLSEVLNATVLKGYNIVGDGTPQALIPILTGFTELELPETRKRMKNANFVNVYPFIWNNFTDSGYATAYGEDLPTTGTFTYRLKGFNEMPTNHYMRSFYWELEKVYRDHPKYCLGNTPRHRVMLKWLRDFYDVYSDVPKFAFLFHSELSHDDYNLIGYADKDIEKFLIRLNEDGILNNTLLIVMSDHGHRFAIIREAQQGKQEERLPYFAIVVPPWFHAKYPTMSRNLRLNANRLSTPFDMYSTLMTVLHRHVPKEGDVTSRSISLFSEIPQERTCTMASIEPHWCACLSWTHVPPEDPIARDVAQSVIDFINQLTHTQRDKCVKLFLQRVTRIEKLQPTKALLKFKKNADKDGFVGDFSDDTKITELIYQIQMKTHPNDGIYEASVKHDATRNTFQVREHEISRINIYGNQEHCIHDTYPNLRKYCYCRQQLDVK